MPTPSTGVAILIGPEGGLDQDERELAHTHGFEPVTIGPRTLRTETAAVVGLTIVQNLWGDFQALSTPAVD